MIRREDGTIQYTLQDIVKGLFDIEPELEYEDESTDVSDRIDSEDMKEITQMVIACTALLPVTYVLAAMFG